MELIDVIIRQIKYSDDLTPAVYERMIKERNQIAQAFRSDGEGEKAKWIGQMERELAQITSDAERRAKEIKAKADAEALAIRNRAYARDPDFADYWMALEAYKVPAAAVQQDPHHGRGVLQVPVQSAGTVILRTAGRGRRDAAGGPRSARPARRTNRSARPPRGGPFSLHRAQPRVYPGRRNPVAVSNRARVAAADTSGLTWWSGPQMYPPPSPRVSMQR